MKFLVLGANDIGYAVAYDLVRSPQVEQVVLLDGSRKRLNAVGSKLPDRKIVPTYVNFGKKKEVVSLMKHCDIAVGCLGGETNLELAKLALSAQISFVGIGDNQESGLSLHQLAQEKQVCTVCNVGLSPGLVTMLALNAISLLEEPYEMRIRLGHLSFNNHSRDSLKSLLIANLEELSQQVQHHAASIRDGDIYSLPALTELEEIDFSAPFGKLEAFNVAHHLNSDLFVSKLKQFDYKAVNYPGFCYQARILKELGLFDTKAIKVGQSQIKPRDLLETLKALKDGSQSPYSDAVLLRITVSGIKQKKPEKIIWECVDFGDSIESIAADTKIKAFSASIIGQMVGSGTIRQSGSFLSHQVVPLKRFLNEMSRRGIIFNMTEQSLGSSLGVRERVGRYRDRSAAKTAKI